MTADDIVTTLRVLRQMLAETPGDPAGTYIAETPSASVALDIRRVLWRPRVSPQAHVAPLPPGARRR